RAAAAARGVAEGLMMAPAAHHGADAVHQERAADHAGRRRCRGAQERTAAAERRRAIGRAVAALALPIRSLTVAALSITLARPLVVMALVILALALGLLQHLARVPERVVRNRRRDVGYRAARGAVLAEDRVAHGIEEAAGLALLRRMRLFQLLDARAGALQRLVLQQH